LGGAGMPFIPSYYFIILKKNQYHIQCQGTRSTIICSQLVKQPLSKKILGCKVEPPIIEYVPITKHFSIFSSFLNLFRTSLFVITNLKFGNLFQKVTQVINLIANLFFSLGTQNPFQSNNQTLLN
jgi:hypothetical protein